ncbi:MAG TPA: hypothetical protein PKV71_13245, partial [Calditrichia bacterium]|nr:hypothetical protein [Calditrichia bacterium]
QRPTAISPPNTPQTTPFSGDGAKKSGNQSPCRRYRFVDYRALFNIPLKKVAGFAYIYRLVSATHFKLEP